MWDSTEPFPNKTLLICKFTVWLGNAYVLHYMSLGGYLHDDCSIIVHMCGRVRYARSFHLGAVRSGCSSWASSFPRTLFSSSSTVRVLDIADLCQKFCFHSLSWWFNIIVATTFHLCIASHSSCVCNWIPVLQVHIWFICWVHHYFNHDKLISWQPPTQTLEVSTRSLAESTGMNFCAVAGLPIIRSDFWKDKMLFNSDFNQKSDFEKKQWIPPRHFEICLIWLRLKFESL